jgi:hypothetical protein
VQCLVNEDLVQHGGEDIILEECIGSRIAILCDRWFVHRRQSRTECTHACLLDLNERHAIFPRVKHSQGIEHRANTCNVWSDPRSSWHIISSMFVLTMPPYRAWPSPCSTGIALTLDQLSSVHWHICSNARHKKRCRSLFETIDEYNFSFVDGSACTEMVRALL